MRIAPRARPGGLTPVLVPRERRPLPVPVALRSTRRRSARRRAIEEAKGRKILPKPGLVDEPDPDDADRLGGLDVRRLIVDECRLAGDQPVSVDQGPEDPRIRLDQALLAGDDDSVEPLEERVARPGNRERLGGPVAQRIEPDLRRAELVEDPDRRRNRVPEHLRPAPPVRLDQLPTFRVATRELLDSLGPRPARVLGPVPLGP